MSVPTVRKTTFRGADVWEVDARALAAECKPRGIPLRRRLPTRKAADAWAREIVEKISAEPRHRIEVRALCDRFLRSRETTVHPDTIKGYRTALRRLQRFCVGADVNYTDELTPGIVGDYRDHLNSDVSQRTAGQYVAVAGVCFGWAVERGYVTHNPFEGKAERTRKTTRRTLTDDERTKIVTGAPGAGRGWPSRAEGRAWMVTSWYQTPETPVGRATGSTRSSRRPGG